MGQRPAADGCACPLADVCREQQRRWFGAVPDTDDGLGHVVVCSYWIEETRRAVRCDSFATLNLPL